MITKDKVQVSPSTETIKNPHVITCCGEHKLIGVYSIAELEKRFTFKNKDGGFVDEIVKIYGVIDGTSGKVAFKYTQSLLSGKWYRFTEVREETGVVELKAVCSCGHVFDSIDYEKHLFTVAFNPSHCPQCGMQIKQISAQTHLLNCFK